MKNFVFILSLMLPNSALAQERNSDLANEMRGRMIQKLCALEGESAQLYMKHRQDNVPITALMAKIEDVGLDGETLKREREWILQAYEYPLYSTDKNKKQAMQTFRNERELNCFRKYTD